MSSEYNIVHQGLYDRLSIAEKLSVLIASYGIETYHDGIKHGRDVKKSDIGEDAVSVVPIPWRGKTLMLFSVSEHSPSIQKLAPLFEALGVERRPYGNGHSMISRGFDVSSNQESEELNRLVDSLLEARQKELEKGTWAANSTSPQARKPAR